jgi:hypothetical protein
MPIVTPELPPGHVGLWNLCVYWEMPDTSEEMISALARLEILREDGKARMKTSSGGRALPSASLSA